MAEEAEGPETGGEAGIGADPAAMALGLGSASRGEADAFLRDQRALIAEQRHHLNRQYAQLGLSIWQLRFGVLLRIATACVGLAFAAAIGFLTWNAASSNELIVDAFTVPPDIAQKGIGGDVLAGQLVDRLATLQAQTSSFRASQTYSNSFGESIKLEIPETGVSLGELDRFLHEKLGHDTHISGALFHTASGLGLTVRVGTEFSDRADGAENDLDSLVQQAAEAIYHRTQPFRYATYVWTKVSPEQGHRLFLDVAANGDAAERSWAYVSVGTTAVDDGGNSATDQAIRINAGFEKRATELGPGNALAWSALGYVEELLGRNEEALSDLRGAQGAMSGGKTGLIEAAAVPGYRQGVQARIDGLLGNYNDAAREQDEFIQAGKTGLTVGNSAMQAVYQALGHDPALADATLAQPAPEPAPRAAQSARYTRRARILMALSRRDWNGVLSAAADSSAAGPTDDFASEESWIALAQARLGRFAEGQARIAKTAEDCYPCLIARGQIAELQKQQAEAEQWFAKAESIGPSLPLASQAWGEALLARGDAAGAIEKFKSASSKGPHFADPLEGWGEALMAQNKSHLALAKFAEAEKYAPNWGRLHLKWGEALAYAGRKDDAKAQWARAAALALTPDEKAELANIVSS